LNAERIPQATMNHHETVQRITVVRDKFEGDLASFLTEKELRNSGKLTLTDKIPDAAWTLKNDPNGINRLAVEVELSPKWRQELDTFVYQSLMQLSQNIYDGIVIFSHSKALLARYKTAFKVDAKVQTWTRPQGAWIKGWVMTIPDRAEGVIQFTLITPELLGKAPKSASTAAVDLSGNALESDDYVDMDDLMLNDYPPEGMVFKL